MTRIGRRQNSILSFVVNNPGHSILSIDRATNSGPKHALTYDSVHRLRDRGLLRLYRVGSAYQVLAF